MTQGQPTEVQSNRDGDTEDMVPLRGLQSPPKIHRVSRRPLGISPVSLLGAGLLGTFALAIVLIVIGSWLIGIVSLGCAAVAAALLRFAVEREPDHPAAQAAVTVADGARSRTRLLGVAARAWSGAAVAIVRFRHRRYRLRWRLRRQLQPLGEAAYRGEEGQVELLSAQARATEQALRQAELETGAAVDAARAEIERERAPAAATRSLSVQDPPGTQV